MAPERRDPVILDNCTFLNLYASGRLDAIAAALGLSLIVEERVRAEALHLFRGGDGPGADERVAVDCAVPVAAGYLTVATLAGIEEATFRRWAALVDDGEAATIAVAIHRGFAVGTDDGRAIRYLGQMAPGTRHLSTLAILRAWVDRAGLPGAEIREVLRAVCQRGHFHFPRRDPLRAWAAALLGEPLQLPPGRR